METLVVEREEVIRALGRIEGRMDGIKESLEEIHKAVEGHGESIEELRSFQTRLKGAAVLGGILFMGLTGIVTMLSETILMR